MGIFKWLSNLPFLNTRRGVSPEELVELRQNFQVRYNAFKLLIAENQEALRIITEIEAALRGDAPFHMSFVRLRCAAVSSSVLQIIEQLNHIAPNKYTALFTVFEQIREQVDASIHLHRKSRNAPLTLPLAGLNREMSLQTGSKMATLGELGGQLGLTVPEGFVITAEAYLQFMEHNKIQPAIDKLIEAHPQDDIEGLHSLSNGIRQFIIGCHIPGALKQEIEDRYRCLEETHGNDVSVAMRSSALGEDGPDMSFAGQYRTVFDVTGENIFLAYKEVIASKYQIQAMMYRLNLGIRDEDVAMCVGCMPLLDSVAGGVAYTGNPLDLNDKNIIILSVWGHPKPVVDGRTSTDMFVVSRQNPNQFIQREIPQKEYEYVYRRDQGIIPIEMDPTKGARASLSDESATKLAQTLLQVEAYFGCAQDVEWIVDTSNRLYILQSRPLKQQQPKQAPATPQNDGATNRPIVLSGGITASPGSASGSVYIVSTEQDAIHFPDNGILVAAQSLPYWAVLLNRAAAVVTEQGSVAGHLANVAREFGVPAIFGLEGATKKLENGQVITVDADGKMVHAGRQTSVLQQPKEKNTGILGSPTYEALRKASDFIVPLRLLDPDSDDFRPQHCSSLHDITRFCHEKSVQEMFETGIEQRFRKSLSKRLHCDGVPMQFWIIDLEDGLQATPEDSRIVHLENIVSIPMLAIWRGMNAIPWTGPPPTDAKGFASVLMGSTADPSLNPSLPSVYTTRNYFMVSKYFCSFQSRFGYHYSTVETLVSDRCEENYIRFQFKGGAADLTRRVARAQLITEVLEKMGFRVFANQDSVFARLENYGRSFMESRLEGVGYLSVHTRQLDMVMGSPTAARKFRQKIFEDIETLSPDQGE